MGFRVYSSINQPTWKSLEAKQGSMGQMKGWFIISQSLWGTWIKWNPQWPGLVEELLKSQNNVPKSNGFEPVHQNNTTHLVSTFFFGEQTETGLPATSLRVLHHFNSIWGKAGIPPVTEWQSNISNSWTMNSVPGPAAIGTCNRYHVVVFLFSYLYYIYIYNDIIYISHTHTYIYIQSACAYGIL